VKFLQLVILLLLAYTLSFAQPLTLENITADLKQGIATKLKGRDGAVVKEIYAKTGNKPLWIGAENQEKMAQLIQALKDPLFN